MGGAGAHANGEEEYLSALRVCCTHVCTPPRCSRCVSAATRCRRSALSPRRGCRCGLTVRPVRDFCRASPRDRARLRVTCEGSAGNVAETSMGLSITPLTLRISTHPHPSLGSQHATTHHTPTRGAAHTRLNSHAVLLHSAAHAHALDRTRTTAQLSSCTCQGSCCWWSGRRAAVTGPQHGWPHGSSGPNRSRGRSATTPR